MMLRTSTRPNWPLLALFGLLLGMNMHVDAKEATLLSDDPELDAQVYSISHQLRCLVCQNQTIADSEADLAKDLKKEVREMLKAGKTEDEIKDYMVERYGDFVLYNPRLSIKTVVLWLGPFALMVVALGFFVRTMKQRKRLQDGIQGPSEAELEQARRLLKENKA